MASTKVQPKPAKPLKLWNGRPHAVLPSDKWDGFHLSVAAHSAADVRRVCVEAGLLDPGAREIRVYWSECWGTSMQDVPVERGIWVQDSSSPPLRLFKNIFTRTHSLAKAVVPKALATPPQAKLSSLPAASVEGTNRLDAALLLLGCKKDCARPARQELVASIRKFAALSGDGELEAACARLA